MAKILNIETSSYVCSVAYAENGNVIVIKENKAEKSHASILTVYIKEILEEKGISPNILDAVSVSKGPGSYTGLRIGVSTAKGLCFGSSLPLLSVCSLQSMAQGILEHDSTEIIIRNHQQNLLLCPMIDARRMEVYTAFYNIWAEQVSDIGARIIDENSFKHELSKNKIIFFGNGADKCCRVIRHPNAYFIENFDPSARFMTLLSEKAFHKKQFEDMAYFEPFYLKDFIPTTPKKII